MINIVKIFIGERFDEIKVKLFHKLRADLSEFEIGILYLEV